ncbi:MAG: hypothetical protein UD936_01960 [Acutalibacteraceae bacterium]|nr:hypothetical protein [Acutalibacteraceae bacterium]
MSERITIYGNKVNLINRMADGVIIDDMEGHTLKYCKETEGIYTIIGHLFRAARARRAEQLAKEQEEQLNAMEVETT